MREMQTESWTAFCRGAGAWARVGMRVGARLLLGAAMVFLALARSGQGVAAGKAQSQQNQAAPAAPAALARPQPAPAPSDDVEQLLQLAHQLKSEMNKTTKDQLSVPAVREAEAIEKLARQMRRHG